jgi:Fe-S cluster biogenesis protein NfuA
MAGICPEQVVEQIEEVFELLQPYFLMHGGMITLDRFDPEDGTVYVKLTGSCDGCPAQGQTLSLYVEAELKKEVPQVMRVVALEE